MNAPFIVFDEFWIPPQLPLVFGEYQPKEDFPNCCIFHKNAMEIAEEFASKFPDCCDVHRIFAKKPYFDIRAYKGLARGILDRISYTNHHIAKKIDQPNWYKDITDYIEYVNLSFGSPAVGNHLYTQFLSDSLKSQRVKIGEAKAQKLLDYIDSLSHPGKVKAELTDINELYTIYQKWKSVFPFGVQPFTNLKDHFAGILPFYSEEPVYNPYTDMSKGKVYTTKELVRSLISMTKEILLAVDSVKLSEEGQIADRKKHRIDLINASHQNNQRALLDTFSKEETRYVTIVGQWLANEKKYFKELTPLLPKPIPETKPVPTQPIAEQPMTNELDQLIDTWMFSLRQKFYIATRWTFSHNEEGKRTLLASFSLNEVLNELGRFAGALKQQLTSTQNWKAIELHLQAEFMAGIADYYDWYNDKAEYRAYFGLDSPYDIILNVAQSTEREIVKYFPNLAIIISPATSTLPATDTRKNTFNSMPLDEVKRWFIQLAENNSKNGKPFLTIEQVEQFIERAFVGNTNIQKLTLNYANREKLILWKLFYQYYQNCVSIDRSVERGVQCRDKYIKLLTDNFTNFIFEKVKDNFSKSNQVEKDWNLLK